MSDMYNQSDSDVTPTPAPKDSRVNITPLAGAVMIQANGEQVMVATPRMVQQLQKDLQRSQEQIRDLQNRCQRIMEQMQALHMQMQQMRKDLSNRVSYD